MGRNKTELTQEEIERRILSGQRIRKYRENSIGRLTQAELSEKLDIQESTIRRYEMNADPKHKGQYSPMPEKVAKRLEAESGIIADYWMGKTAETTYEGRMAELGNAKAADEAWEQLHRLRAEELERRRNFFYMCGYRYESIEGTALDDFCGITEDTQGLTPRPHILTNYADNTRHELTQEQFKDLFDKLQDTINFACFQADRANQ